MSEARSRILQRLGRGEGTVVEPLSIPVRRIDWSPEELLRRFRERMESVRGEVHEVGADWPQRLFELLREKGANNLLYGPGGPWGGNLSRGWRDPDAIRLVPYLESVESCREALFQATDAGFTSCRGAIAETGSLVLWPTPDEPRLLSLVPPIHVVLLDGDRIASTFHEHMTEQSWAEGMPTNALLISGPSKSADIEQTLAYGVHGPKELIVLVRRVPA
jgi:L-lactate dehydrogenase complex protein LldG